MDSNDYTCSTCRHGFLADTCAQCEYESEARERAKKAALWLDWFSKAKHAEKKHAPDSSA